MIVESKVKEFGKGQGLQVGGDVAEKLQRETERILKNACDRAKENGRKTLKAIDI